MWRVKPKADDKQDPGSSAAPINMVFMMPREFMAPNDNDEESRVNISPSRGRLPGTTLASALKSRSSPGVRLDMDKANHCKNCFN